MWDIHTFPYCSGESTNKQRDFYFYINFCVSAMRRMLKMVQLFSFFLFFLFCFLGPHLRHMEVPRLEVELELLPPAYTTATATPDPSHVCELHHSSRQHRILNPLSGARDRTFNLTVPSWIHFRCITTGTPIVLFFKLKYSWFTVLCSSF